ncbi:VOC family protein [bacterium]|nr:VOC family protein [bacterium]
MITKDFSNFADSLIFQLPFDISNLELDHFGYQCSSAENYDSFKVESQQIGNMISEEIVSGRRVSIFRFKDRFKYKSFDILGFELVEPKIGQVCESELDHLEFVIPVSFDEYLMTHENANWDISAMEREDFPKIVLKLNHDKSIKFHTKNIFEEIPD